MRKKSDPYGSFVMLKDVLPLNVPLAVMIEPTNLCNFRCTFCPNSDHDLLKEMDRKRGSMDFELFCKIVNDFYHMCTTYKTRLKRLQFYKDGEPLLNKNICKMIHYAKQRQISETTAMTTNGTLLTKEMAAGLIDSGLDALRVSIEHVTDDGYKKVTRTYADYNKVLQNVTCLFEEKQRRKSALQIHATILDTGLSDAERKKFETDFSPVADTLAVGQLMGWSRSDTTDWKMGMAPNREGKGGRIVCSEPFSKLAVNFDGTVSICCVDWSHGTVVGDLKTQSVMDVWNGEKIRELRLMHLRGQRSQHRTCGNCDYMQGKSEYDLLDNDRERLLEIYSKKQGIQVH